MMEWISVEEKMPNDIGYYLVFRGKEFWPIEVMMYTKHLGGDMGFLSMYGAKIYDVTHWMPLPELPKE